MNSHADLDNTIEPVVSERDKEKQLLVAAEKGNLVALNALLNQNIQQTKDWYGNLPLHLAAEQGHAHIIEALLKADITQIDEGNHKGYTAIYLASEFNHTTVVDLLLNHGAGIYTERCEDDLYCAPMVAAKNKNEKLTSQLIHHLGVNTTIETLITNFMIFKRTVELLGNKNNHGIAIDFFTGLYQSASSRNKAFLEALRRELTQISMSQLELYKKQLLDYLMLTQNEILINEAADAAQNNVYSLVMYSKSRILHYFGFITVGYLGDLIKLAHCYRMDDEGFDLELFCSTSSINSMLSEQTPRVIDASHTTLSTCDETEIQTPVSNNVAEMLDDTDKIMDVVNKIFAESDSENICLNQLNLYLNDLTPSQKKSASSGIFHRVESHFKEITRGILYTLHKQDKSSNLLAKIDVVHSTWKRHSTEVLFHKRFTVNVSMMPRLESFFESLCDSELKGTFINIMNTYLTCRLLLSVDIMLQNAKDLSIYRSLHEKIAEEAYDALIARHMYMLFGVDTYGVDLSKAPSFCASVYKKYKITEEEVMKTNESGKQFGI